MKKGQAPRPNGGMTCLDNGFKTHPFTGNWPYLVPIHKSILGTNFASNAEISNFLQGQGNQGITRRRISGTPHK